MKNRLEPRRTRMTDAEGQDQPAGIGRRTMLGRLIGAIAALVAAGWAAPLAIFGIGPALNRRALRWTDAGRVDQLAVNAPRELDVVIARRDGWRDITAVKSFWAYHTPEGQVVAFSPICPHLGCAFNWRPDENRFVCPCHLSVFALNGSVLGGPAPRPLDTLSARVEDGRLFVVPQEFKIGVSTKIPV